MFDKETQEFIELFRAADERIRAEQLEAKAKRDLEISMLSKMDIEAVGAAFICYANSLKCAVDDVGLSGEALKAYNLICDIMHLEMWEC